MYYGWKIVGTLFVTLTFCSGFGFYNHAVTLQALITEKQLSIEAASSAVSIFFLASGLVGLGIAALLDRHDVRIIITGGAILAAGALLTNVCMLSIVAVRMNVGGCMSFSARSLMS